MNILQINTFDNRGGAAKVCYRIKEGLDFRGVTNWLFVKSSSADSKTNVFQTKKSIVQKILHKIFKTEGLGKNTLKELRSLPCWKESEIVHLHNIHGGYFNIFNLTKLSKEKKCLWTLHDPWILYNTSLIPQYKNIFKDRNRFFDFLKRRVINKTDIVMTCPSQWLKNLVEKEYPDKNIIVIPNGVDTEIFFPTDKSTARNKLNLPEDKKIILFVANGGLKNTQKGSEYIEAARNAFPEFVFVEIGGGKYIDNERDMALYYSAVDFLLLPSLAENLPLCVLESMSCGTPVVAFDTGGISEIIDHKQNGYLAKYKDVSDLIYGIKFIIEQGSQNGLSENARKKIISVFDEKIIFEKYMTAYENLLK